MTKAIIEQLKEDKLTYSKKELDVFDFLIELSKSERDNVSNIKEAIEEVKEAESEYMHRIAMLEDEGYDEGSSEVRENAVMMKYHTVEKSVLEKYLKIM